MLESLLDSQLPAGNDAIEASNAREVEYELQAAKEQAEQVRPSTSNPHLTTHSLLSVNAISAFVLYIHLLIILC
jgi:hypothetical protein